MRMPLLLPGPRYAEHIICLARSSEHALWLCVPLLAQCVCPGLLPEFHDLLLQLASGTRRQPDAVGRRSGRLSGLSAGPGLGRESGLDLLARAGAVVGDGTATEPQMAKVRPRPQAL